MQHLVRIWMTFGWIRAGGALEKCRKYFTRDDTKKQSPAASCSRVKYTILSSSPIVGSTGPSDNLKSISVGI